MKQSHSKPALDLNELAGYNFNFGYTFIVLHKPGSDRCKTPLHKNWQEFSNDKFDPKEWMQQGHNIGIRIDWDFMVIDADPRNYLDGDDPLLRLLEDFGLSFDTVPHVYTGGGGDHLYLRLPQGARKLRSTHPDYPGIEFKTSGQVVAAGSVHPNGKTYEWGLFSPPLSKIPFAPAKLITLLQRVKRNNGEPTGTHTPEQLKQMLSGLYPAHFRDHGQWLILMMACHHATDGQGDDVFIDWSTGDKFYTDHSNVIRYRWQSLNSEGTDKVTYHTLYKILHDAKKGHLIPPMQTAAEAFGAIGSEA